VYYLLVRKFVQPILDSLSMEIVIVVIPAVILTWFVYLI